MLANSLFRELDSLNSLEPYDWRRRARQTGKDFDRAL